VDAYTTEQAAGQRATQLGLTTDPGGGESSGDGLWRLRTDCRSLLQSLQAAGVRDARELGMAKALVGRANVGGAFELAWCKGHSGEPGNELADEEAKRHCPTISRGETARRAWAWHVAKSALRLEGRRQAAGRLRSSKTKQAFFLYKVTGGSFDISPAMRSLGKGKLEAGLPSQASPTRQEQVLYDQVRSGFCTGLRAWAHRIGKAPDDVCQRCKAGRDDVVHLMFDCPALDAERAEMRRTIQALGQGAGNSAKVSPHEAIHKFPKVTIDFLRKTGVKAWSWKECEADQSAMTLDVPRSVVDADLDGVVAWTIKRGLLVAEVAGGEVKVHFDIAVSAARSIWFACAGSAYEVDQRGVLRRRNVADWPGSDVLGVGALQQDREETAADCLPASGAVATPPVADTDQTVQEPYHGVSPARQRWFSKSSCWGEHLARRGAHGNASQAALRAAKKVGRAHASSTAKLAPPPRPATVKQKRLRGVAPYVVAQGWLARARQMSEALRRLEGGL
jgi:hypothetical protein